MSIDVVIIRAKLASSEGQLEGCSHALTTVKTFDEAAKLIEQGFDYVCDIDGVKLFRRRK
jgi:hypothetical protein